MRTRSAVTAACLLLLTLSGAAFPSTDGPPSASPAVDNRSSDVSAGLAGAGTLPACRFSDIAYSATFRSEGPEYVTSAEYAAALRAVANGDSKYSAAEIPQSWRGAVADAKAELDLARREATDLRDSVQDTESSFRKAERFAEMLLARQQFASKKGLKC